MNLSGKLFIESPIYRGNARKTLFSRDGDGTQRLVSLAGEIAGTAQALMDAFIGTSRDGRNIGLLNQLWFRLYKSPLPDSLITQVECNLRKEHYSRDRFFDLRMGIKLDEDRWAAEANANYKMETLFRNSVFDFRMKVNDSTLHEHDNETKLFFVLQELKEGRFWFGAGKSKGLGRCRLEMELPFSVSVELPRLNQSVNHLMISLRFSTENPLLVGWNWGKVDPAIPAFAAIEGRLLVEAMRNLPEQIRKRMEMAIGGPILSPDDWKRKMTNYLPKLIAIWLREKSISAGDSWIIPESAISKLEKGKFPISKKILTRIEPLFGKPFPGREAAETELSKVMGKKANLVNRVLEYLEKQSKSSLKFDGATWHEIAKSIGIDETLAPDLEAQIHDESALVAILNPACQEIMPQLYQQVDRQIKLLQSDAWIDMEILNREDHMKIKTMILNGKITENDWDQPDFVPEGIKPAVWKEFLASHEKVGFRYLTNTKNLQKSITNDQNHIRFLKSHRDRVRQELVQPYNTDFRAGGPSNRDISKKYGKPYDTLFMRMLTWTPSATEGTWEIYIPGSTIKGAFRKRASQILKTLWGESDKTDSLLNRLFGTQGKTGMVFFSDAYLADPKVPEETWCSMDGVRMDPRTAQPIEEAKADYLYAYGKDLSFNLRLDIQDIQPTDLETLSILSHLILDFRTGEIPLGGEKTNGLGWVKADIARITWLAAQPEGIGKTLFGKHELEKQGLWYRLNIQGDNALSVLQSMKPIITARKESLKTVPKANQGFISHRAFGGFCGKLIVQGEILTPISVQESGEPSYKKILGNEPINGWDFFSIAPAAMSSRGTRRLYALPGKSIRGMLRHIYTIASNSYSESTDISQLNPSDSLFGWVGTGPNQAIMGRLSFDFAKFENPELAWFKIPYPYGNWQFIDGDWKNIPKGRVAFVRIKEEKRVFTHAPLAPAVQRLDDFTPDIVQANYMRAILPGSRCHFAIRFWNLEKAELERLIWCITLDKGLAHKMGRCRYLGFGSLRFTVLPESYIINWENRYSTTPVDSWHIQIIVQEWINTSVISNYEALREVLNADHI